MKSFCFAGLVALVVSISATGATRADQYGAIAYSQSTGAIGYSYGSCSRAAAENSALSYCDADDAQIVVWSVNAYCALALGDEPGAYGFGWGSSQCEAESMALLHCSQYTTGGYIAQWVFSGN